ncbi:MAG TPA: IclR family transcriptional regulator [Roseiarcus sp.]|nr:IclR family transcriptional regulator [Roseiarcus sp.]
MITLEIAHQLPVSPQKVCNDVDHSASICNTLSHGEGSAMEIRSVTKAIRLLQMLGEGAGSSHGVSELARMVEIDKSSVSRMLRTLEQAGFVEQDPVTQRYSLGLALGVLGYKALLRTDLRTASHALLQKLAEKTGECAHAAILADKRAFYIDQAAPERRVGVDAPVGTLAPLHCTALGKVLLACQPPRVGEELMKAMTFEPYTRRTISNADALRDHLNSVRLQGVAFDDEEFSVGVRCMAAPVFRYDGAVCGAIGISGPSPRMTDARLSEWEQLLREVSREVSNRLGWDDGSSPTPASRQKVKATAAGRLPG